SMEAAASSIWLLFFLLEYETQFTLTALDWLNFNSDNYPARGGLAQSRFGSFAFALSSPEMNSQNLLISKQMNGYKV
ncbi:hypothetical protein BOO29_19340, partial [Vibrio navarrensis]|uniref:hypothetical protein n=1 Tax=Vibrio navarrensis TaxID=29495 RepID=UPI001D048C96